VSADIKKSERTQISNLIMHLELLEKQGQAKARISRWEEIIKTREETNITETQIINQIQKLVL
jgi:hypothetical protein